MSLFYGIQGKLLEVTAVGCKNLRDTEIISRQDPYICLEYANTKFRTRTCTDGGKNPKFEEKFVFSLIEGLHEINVTVWNDNTFSRDDFIGDGRVKLYNVLSKGYDDTPQMLQTRAGRNAGEVKLIMHFPNALKQYNPSKTHAAVAPTHSYVHTAQPSHTPHPSMEAYPYHMYPHVDHAMYPPSAYLAPANPAGYPPPMYPHAYPSPATHQEFPVGQYPPYYYPPQAPPGYYPGVYPPPY